MQHKALEFSLPSIIVSTIRHNTLIIRDETERLAESILNLCQKQWDSSIDKNEEMVDQMCFTLVQEISTMSLKMVKEFNLLKMQLTDKLPHIFSAARIRDSLLRTKRKEPMNYIDRIDDLLRMENDDLLRMEKEKSFNDKEGTDSEEEETNFDSDLKNFGALFLVDQLKKIKEWQIENIKKEKPVSVLKETKDGKEAQEVILVDSSPSLLGKRERSKEISPYQYPSSLGLIDLRIPIPKPQTLEPLLIKPKMREVEFEKVGEKSVLKKNKSSLSKVSVNDPQFFPSDSDEKSSIDESQGSGFNINYSDIKNDGFSCNRTFVFPDLSNILISSLDSPLSTE